jgi:NAD(P) transhydrogenase subunit beta
MQTAPLLSPNQSALVYLVASVFFILALKGLSHPLSARRGNRFGIAGMAIAVLVTFALTGSILISIGALVIGAIAVVLAATNTFGGFLVTERMLEMFKKKEPKK